MDNVWSRGSVASYLSLPREYLGFEPTASDEDVRVFCEEIFPEMVCKPCATLTWCPFGPAAQPPDGRRTAAEEDESRSCAITGIRCPVYILAEPWTDPTAKQPDDEEAVTLCVDCYEELLRAAGKSEE